MVVALGPGRFYGSSLPRPRYYTDVKLNSERVDPPTSVLDPLLTWANEAHWSMGGLSFKRLRLQGRIEGSVKKLRSEHEKVTVDGKRSALKGSGSSKSDGSSTKRLASVSPPPAPIASKRKRIIDDDGDEEEERGEVRVNRRLARKLGDDFDKVASETVNKKNMNRKSSSEAVSMENSMDRSSRVALRARSRRSEGDIGIDDLPNQAVVEKGPSTKAKKLGSGNKARSVREKSISPAKRVSPRLSKGESS